MIDTVKRFLREHGLIGAGSATCNIIIGRSFVFEVLQGSEIYITVKASKNADLQREFECQTISHAALPEYVPAPLAFGEAKGLSLLASEGVPHAKLTATAMRGAGARLFCGIKEYARRSAGTFATQQWTSAHHQELEKVLIRLDDKKLAALLESYISRLGVEQMLLLPHIRQHGDLVVSNIGVTTRGMVIFDWEDFGRVELPGFDIALLLVSSLDYDVALLRRWFELREPRELDDIIIAAADDLGFSRPMLWGLLPVYLAHFLYLKEMLGYRPSIRELLRRLITDLCHLPRASPGHADPQ